MISQLLTFKSTTPNNCIVMQCVDRNSLLTAKQYNFDIKCRCNSESYERLFFLPSLGVVRIFTYIGRFFKRSDISPTDWTLHPIEHGVFWLFEWNDRAWHIYPYPYLSLNNNYRHFLEWDPLIVSCLSLGMAWTNDTQADGLNLLILMNRHSFMFIEYIYFICLQDEYF